MGRRHRAGRFLILRGCTSAYIPLFVQEEAPETLPLDSGRALPCTRKGVPPLTLSRDSVGDTFKLCPRVNAEISPLRRRPEGFAVALWTASPTLPCFLIFIVAEGIAPAGATKGLSDRPLETFGAATFGVVCGLVLVVAKRFLVCVCKSGAQILPHSKSRRVLPAAAFVIHKDSTFRALIPHPCPRMLPAPSLPPPSRRRGGRSTS